MIKTGVASKDIPNAINSTNNFQPALQVIKLSDFGGAVYNSG